MANIKIYGTLIRDTESDKIVQGSQVEGGYFVCKTLPSWGDMGQLCYCSTDNKFYQYRTVTEEIGGVSTTVNKWVDVRIDDAATRLDTLIGDDKEKSVRKIANEELAEQLLSDNADASFKTLQELAAWLEDHPEDVAAINAAIDLLRQDLTKEENRAIAAEGVLQKSLEDSVKTLNEAISAETSAREQADATLKQWVIDYIYNNIFNNDELVIYHPDEYVEGDTAE